MDNNVCTILNAKSDNCLIITCEHASAVIPAEYKNLGLTDEELNRHIARDKGAKEITEMLAKKLGCFAIMGNYSRLLIDLNRRENEVELILEESDKTLVPNNQCLSAEEKEKRLQKYYRPYYMAIEKHINQLCNKGIKPIVFSVHSYTPQLKGGEYRPWHAGILYHQPTKLASYLYHGLKINTDKNIGENVPYDLRKYNTGAVIMCGAEKELDYALIEIRDDEFSDLKKGAAYWVEKLENALRKYTAC